MISLKFAQPIVSARVVAGVKVSTNTGILVEIVSLIVCRYSLPWQLPLTLIENKIKMQGSYVPGYV